MAKTTYLATGPGGIEYRRTSEREYRFATVITDHRPAAIGGRPGSWAEWSSRRDLADKVAASWNAKRGLVPGRVIRGWRGLRTNAVDYGPGFSAVVVEARPVTKGHNRRRQAQAHRHRH